MQISPINTINNSNNFKAKVFRLTPEATGGCYNWLSHTEGCNIKELESLKEELSKVGENIALVFHDIAPNLYIYPLDIWEKAEKSTNYKGKDKLLNNVLGVETLPPHEFPFLDPAQCYRYLIKIAEKYSSAKPLNIDIY